MVITTYINGETFMINGLDISHYPHRTPIENVAFFADKGFSSVSIYGFFMDRLCRDKELSAQLASVVNEKNIVLTVHQDRKSVV